MQHFCFLTAAGMLAPSSRCHVRFLFHLFHLFLFLGGGPAALHAARELLAGLRVTSDPHKEDSKHTCVSCVLRCVFLCLPHRR